MNGSSYRILSSRSAAPGAAPAAAALEDGEFDVDV